MRRVIAVALKELRQVRRDPLTLMLLLGLPAVMLLLYGYALNFDVRHVRLVVEDRDQSASSRRLIADFTRSTWFELAGAVPARADADGIFRRNEARAVLVIPEGHERDLLAGRAAPVQFLIDGADANTATTVLNYAVALAAERNRALIMTERGRSLVIANRSATGPPIRYDPRAWYNPELESTKFLVPGLIGSILMLTSVLSTALAVVREKERGTLEQLRMTALRPGELILGKVAPYLLIAVAGVTATLVLARLLFGVGVRGPIPALAAATLLYIVGALGLGLLVSSVADSQAAAFQYGSLLATLPAIFLSGFIFPIRAMPIPLQWLTYAFPARYFLTILRGIMLKGTGLSPHLNDLALLGLYSAAIFGVAWVRLTREER